MEVARTSETSIDNYFTLQYISEDRSELHTRRREILKSHIEWSLFLRRSTFIFFLSLFFHHSITYSIPSFLNMTVHH
jgi:hypothetical protein